MNGRLGMTGDQVGWGDGEIAKAIPHEQAVQMAQRFADKGNYRYAIRARSLSRLTGRVADRPNHRAYERQLMLGKRRYRQEMALALRDEGMPYSPPKRSVSKVDTTMSDRHAAAIARKYGTKGPLPSGLDRETKMKAYEGRYIASGGRKSEKWQRRANRAETGRNIGLAGATGAAAALLASRGRRVGSAMARTRVVRHATPHRLETAALSSALGGGWSELYGEHARSRRASYQNTPAGVAGSALSRMKAYTPDRRN